MRLRHRHKRAASDVGPDGFVTVMSRHTALFYPRGSTLVVSFDNMKSREQSAPAYPWAYAPIRAAGHSHLGIVMSRRNDWFRHSDLAAFFDDLRQDGFFARFSRIVFYGASMGGYGALTYSGACPGAEVFVFSPQTSLDPSVVSFETRYRSGFKRGDWAGCYADGAISTRLAARVTVVSDPYEPIDRQHIERLPNHNLIWLKCPFFGHVPARHLKHMGVLGQVARAGWAGQLDQAGFALMRRYARGQSQSLARAVLLRALENGHSDLVARALEDLARSRPGWRFPRLQRALGADLSAAA